MSLPSFLLRDWTIVIQKGPGTARHRGGLGTTKISPHHASHGRISNGWCLMGVYLMGVYLTGRCLMGVHLIGVCYGRAPRRRVSYGRVTMGVYFVSLHVMGILSHGRPITA